ncbi:MAG: hypothetical protein ACPGXL_01125, partial [Chitinophagales bacterium]
MPKGVRLIKAAKEINVGIDTIVAHLKKKGFEVESKPSTKLTADMYSVLRRDFKTDSALKERAAALNFRTKRENVAVKQKDVAEASPTQPDAVKPTAKVTEQPFSAQPTQDAPPATIEPKKSLSNLLEKQIAPPTTTVKDIPKKVDTPVATPIKVVEQVAPKVPIAKTPTKVSDKEVVVKQTVVA